MSENLTSTLHILPGPIYDPAIQLEEKFRELSTFSKGVVVSTALHDSIIRFGNYKIVLVDPGEEHRLRQAVRLAWEAVSQARMLQRSGRLDLVVCYDPLKTGLIGSIVKTICGCKLVVELNGVYDSPALYKSRGALVALKKHVYKTIQKLVIRRADAIKCLFKGQLQGLTISNNVQVHHFFDFTSISEADYKINKDKTILSMGFPAYIKGFDILIAAFKELESDFLDWRLVIVGHFGAKDKQLLNSAVGEAKQIEIRKPVDFSEVPSLIDSCEIFALVSRTEGMGRVLLEAMARSKARIGTRVGGIPTVISHDQDGLLVDAESVADLRQALRRLMVSEAERKRLAESARLRFQREFTVESYGQNVKSLYDNLRGF